MCDLCRLIKVGVGIMEDRKRLFQRTFVLPVSCVDLRNVAVLCGFTSSLSLASLAKELTGAELDKDPGVHRGDWEADVLSPAQVSDSGCVPIEVATMLYKYLCMCMLHACLYMVGALYATYKHECAKNEHTIVRIVSLCLCAY